MRGILNDLITLADEFDGAGNIKAANLIDEVIKLACIMDEEGVEKGSDRFNELVSKVPEVAKGLIDTDTGLVFIPTLVKHIGKSVGIRVAKEIVEKAAREGLIELREESGLGRLCRRSRMRRSWWSLW